MTDELAFNSKIDLGYLILILTAVAACLWGIARIWDADSLLLIPVAVVLAVGVLLPVWMIASLKYFMSDRVLRVRCGPFSWRIPIRDITEVTPTQNSKKSPTLSFDQLLIEYGDSESLVISPEPRKEFLRQLDHRRKRAA